MNRNQGSAPEWGRPTALTSPGVELDFCSQCCMSRVGLLLTDTSFPQVLTRRRMPWEIKPARLLPSFIFLAFLSSVEFRRFLLHNNCLLRPAILLRAILNPQHVILSSRKPKRRSKRRRLRTDKSEENPTGAWKEVLRDRQKDPSEKPEDPGQPGPQTELLNCCGHDNP